MNKTRLLKLRDLMVKVGNKELQIQKLRDFDITVWISDCGTFACALGWMASDPGFREDGWLFMGNVPYYIDPTTGSVYGDYGGAEKYFDLSWKETKTLVSTVSGNNTPADVIRAIDKLLTEDTTCTRND